jgi:threonine synthase
VRYVSTRGRAPELGFADVLLAGVARDGGLYVPEAWPELALPAGRSSYVDTALAVVRPYVGGEIGDEDLARLCREAYATFRHPAVCPLVQIGPDEWLLELFHGPTLAFKDVALQLVGRLFDHVLASRGERVLVVGATSGDTGSAAIEALRRCAHVDVVMLYPHGRISDVQRRQMTTVDSPNVHTVAVEGTFDDCQDLVKAMFADIAFRDRHRLSAVNSINWARVMAQIVYYVTAARSLGGGPGGRPVTFSVPTGNFGNVLAGWVAQRTGLPLGRLVVGSNRNDILTRFLHSGIMATSGVVPTLSPSMDIQVSSNVERLLFELNHRDGGLTAEQMLRFRDTGRLVVEPDQYTELGECFDGARIDDEATLSIIKTVYEETGQLVDPHTAVGIGAAQAARAAQRPPGRAEPVVVLATAHPAKFPDAVEQATGVRPALPAPLAESLERPERSALVPNDLVAVQAHVDDVAGRRSGR